MYRYRGRCLRSQCLGVPHERRHSRGGGSWGRRRSSKRCLGGRCSRKECSGKRYSGQRPLGWSRFGRRCATSKDISSPNPISSLHSWPSIHHDAQILQPRSTSVYTGYLRVILRVQHIMPFREPLKWGLIISDMAYLHTTTTIISTNHISQIVAQRWGE